MIKTNFNTTLIAMFREHDAVLIRVTDWLSSLFNYKLLIFAYIYYFATNEVAVLDMATLHRLITWKSVVIIAVISNVVNCNVYQGKTSRFICCNLNENTV